MLWKKAVFVSMLAGCGALAACSTPSEITTRDGRTTYTTDAPQTDNDNGFITYKKKNGEEVKINKDDVKEIKPVE
jgi:hypothetical protein